MLGGNTEHSDHRFVGVAFAIKFANRIPTKILVEAVSLEFVLEFKPKPLEILLGVYRTPSILGGFPTLAICP